MGVMDGKVAIVTGAGRGVGRGVALDLARAGAAVVVNDLGVSLDGGRRRNPGRRCRSRAKSAPSAGAPSRTAIRVASWEGAHRIVQAALDSFGRIDGVVNNAGNLRDSLFHKMTEEEFDAVIAVHLKGSFNVSRAAAPHFKSQASGAYVHMTSTSGLVGNFGQANYSAAKLGVAALSKSIALDMQRFNVRSNAVAPFAWTRMIDSIPTNTPEQQKRVEGLKKLVPEKIAPFVTALLSDAGAGVTGQIFGVRNNEIYLFSQPRPIRTAHTSDGWTPETHRRARLPDVRERLLSPASLGRGLHLGPGLTMAIRPELLLGHEFPEARQTYTKRDAILYALGVGLGAEPDRSRRSSVPARGPARGLADLRGDARLAGHVDSRAGIRRRLRQTRSLRTGRCLSRAPRAGRRNRGAGARRFVD